MRHIQPITVHHKLPESFGWNLRPNNTIQLRQNVHRAVHQIFEDDTPIQRLRRLLEVDKTVMNPWVYLEISNVLRKFEWIIEYQSYEPDCFNVDQFMKRLTR